MFCDIYDFWVRYLMCLLTKGRPKPFRINLDMVSHLVKETSSDKLTEDAAAASLAKLETMNEMIFPIYDDVINFATTFKEENLEMFKTKKAAKGKGFKTRSLTFC